MRKRTATVQRKTTETDITVKIDLDGTGEKRKIATGIGFFDHMLDAFARHGYFDLEVRAKGDLHIDAHHTVEDTGIVLGEAIRKALGDKKGIRRYGSMLLPMDETLPCGILFRDDESPPEDHERCARKYPSRDRGTVQGLCARAR